MSKSESHPLIEPFLDALWLERGLSDNTVSSYRTDLEKFALWLDEQGGSLLLAGLDDIQHYLAWRVDQQFAASSTARFLSALRRFYQYLNREKLRSDDPTVLLEGPKLPKKLPSDLSEAEVEALLQAPLVDEPLELRDKAMLELLYATGLRVSELVGLTAEHVSLRQGLVRVVGKGNKERLVPMGEEAVHWLERYYREARTLLLGGTSSDVVFPSKQARMMTRQTFWHRIKLYAQRAGIQGELSPTPCATPSPPICSTTAPICG
ncbi:tyrosine recombinase XerD [Aeromonas hydrophila]|nr:tyrosine recombinase XerD [Aeromonas hydrophila]